jgi:hypothetical protein
MAAKTNPNRKTAKAKGGGGSNDHELIKTFFMRCSASDLRLIARIAYRLGSEEASQAVRYAVRQVAECLPPAPAEFEAGFLSVKKRG